MAVHGGNTEEIARKYNFDSREIIDFSANINPVGLNENVKAAMINAIDKVIKYPDITYFDLILPLFFWGASNFFLSKFFHFNGALLKENKVIFESLSTVLKEGFHKLIRYFSRKSISS